MIIGEYNSGKLNFFFSSQVVKQCRYKNKIPCYVALSAERLKKATIIFNLLYILFS